MIENIAWIMTGFIFALVTMEVAWRIAKGIAAIEKISYGSKSIAMEEARTQWT